MQRRGPLACLLVLTAGCIGGTPEPGSSKPGPSKPRATADESADASRPNILFVYADDHASHAISSYGSVINETPNIDRLAREGMRFANHFVGNSICAPCRATVLTGKHSHKNGVNDNGDTFDGAQVTFPKRLQDAGYQTALVGKWHLKSDPTGFDYWEVLNGQGPYYNPAMITAEGRREHTGYTTDVITDLALDWLAEKRDPEKPFLLMYQHKAPHREWAPGPDHLTLYDGETIPEPATLFDDYEGRTKAARGQEMTLANHMSKRDLKLTPPPRMNEEQLAAWNAAYGPKNEAFEAANLSGDELVRWRYQRYVKDYLRCIASIDDNLGRVLDYLDETGLADETIVVYSSDQGFYLGDHGWYDKRWMYEESLRTPLLVRWPGVTEPGSVDENMTQNIDLASTFLTIAGANVPGDVDGESLEPLLRGRAPEGWRSSIYYHYYEYPAVHMVARHYGVRTDRYKLIHFYQNDEWELFDLESDPNELSSVYGDPAYAAVEAELKRELARLQEQYGETAPGSEPEAPEEPAPAPAKPVDVAIEEVFRLPDIERSIPAAQNLSMKPISVGAFVTPEKPDGVIVAQGGRAYGFVLYLANGVPRFGVRAGAELFEVAMDAPIQSRTHVAGVLDADGMLQLYVGGERVASGEGRFIDRFPHDGLSLGRDTGSAVGDYSGTNEFSGAIEDVRLYWGALGADAIAEWASSASR